MNLTCSIPECDKPAKTRGWCGMHYERWRAHGDPLVTRRPAKLPPGAVCTVDGCTRPQKSKGYCRSHYDRWRATGDPQPRQPPKRPNTCPEHGDYVAGCDGCRRYQRLRVARWHRERKTKTADENPAGAIEEAFAELAQMEHRHAIVRKIAASLRTATASPMGPR